MKHIVLLAMLVSLNASAASSVVALDAQAQSDCFVNLVKEGVKPSNAHKFCRNIYGK